LCSRIQMIAAAIVVHGCNAIPVFRSKLFYADVGVRGGCRELDRPFDAVPLDGGHRGLSFEVGRELNYWGGPRCGAEHDFERRGEGAFSGDVDREDVGRKVLLAGRGGGDDERAARRDAGVGAIRF